MYYFVLFLFFIFCVTLDTILIESKVRQLLFVSSCIILCFTAGLKYETGVDWYEYTKMFNEIPVLSDFLTFQARMPILEYTDIGYVLLNSSIKSLGGNIQAVFFVVQLLMSICLFVSLNRYTSYKITSVYLYFSLLFFVLDMSGIRQGIALSIFFVSIRFVKDRRPIAYLLSMIIAFLFHWSAIFLLPMYFVLRLEVSSKLVVALYVFFVLVFLSNIKWLGLVFEALISRIAPGTLVSRIDFYTSNTIFSESRNLTSSLIIILIFTALLSSIIIRRKQLEKNEYFSIFFNLFLIQLFLFFCLYEFSQISERLRYYTVLSSVILVPYILKSVYDIRLRLMSCTLVLLFGLYFSRAYIFGADYTVAYQPYQNYFFYKLFDFDSDGRERLRKHSNINDSE